MFCGDSQKNGNEFGRGRDTYHGDETISLVVDRIMIYYTYKYLV